LSLKPVPFWFLRHGETDWNAEGLSQGRTDIPLNRVGMMQAERAAEALAGVTFAAIVSSPLRRARATAETVVRRQDCPLAFDDELMEVCFGDQEGQPMGDWYDDWIAGDYTPEGAESFADLRARCVRAVNRATARPGPVLVVGHGALFRAFRAEAGLAPNIRTPNALPLHCVPGSPWLLQAMELPAEC
jgi:probable phosphoglycerate mutase